MIVKESFDLVAKDYSNLISNPPLEYLVLLKKIFKLKHDDSVLDLGCGSGLLTFPLNKIAKNVVGIDSSNMMLKIAKMNDTKQEIQWICQPVEKFQFGINNYNLIVAFEAFHLFTRKQDLLKSIIHSLKENSYFAIGWCQYGWEEIFRSEIINIFSDFGIKWGTWDYVSCPDLNERIEKIHLRTSSIYRRKINHFSKYNLHDISVYLSTIQKTHNLSKEKRVQLRDILVNVFYKKINSKYLECNSIYWVKYFRKLK